jgi:hypothetical protein
VGPAYVTPSLNVGQVGFDSNVLKTPTDRTGDFVADGGPGLALLLPLGRRLDIGAHAAANFLYFAETESQRRTTWLAEAFVRFEGSRSRTSLAGAYTENFRRPDFEIDDRVAEVNRRADVNFSRQLGRNELLFGFAARRLEIEDGQVFAGADLATNLNRSIYRGLVGFRLGLTTKTSIVVGADHQVDDFLQVPERDTTSNRLYGGLEIESVTRLSGQALVGARRLRPRVAEGARWFPYVNVGLRYRLGPKTAFAVRVNRDQQFSAFSADTGTQTSRQLTSELALGRRLWGPMEIRMFGGLRQLETDGAVRLDVDGEAAVRTDDEWYGGANLGLRFRNWFRVGFEARYSDRASTFEDFGVDGLLLGVTITATPGDIIDLVARN